MKKQLRALSVLLIALAVLLSGSALAAPKPESVTLSLSQEDAAFDLQDFKALSLSAVVQPADASQRITWSTSNSSIARVSSTGKVTFRKRGVVTITATAYRTNVSQSVTLTLTDSALPDLITLNCDSEMTLEQYDTFQLTPTVLPETANKAVRYKSSGRAVSVSKSGLITASRSGTATVTCYSDKDNKILATVKVTVVSMPAPKTITLSPEVKVVTVGDVIDFDAAIAPEGSCRFLTWKSSSSRTGSITSEGVFTALKTGSVTITCQSKHNSRIRDTQSILIVGPNTPMSITLDADELLMHPTQTHQLTATVLPSDRTQDVLWKSSSSRVSVSKDGLLTAKKTGTVTITCYSAVNKKVLATVKVKVEHLPAPDSIDLSASPDTVLKGETVKLVALPVPADRSAEFEYSSSNRRIATVSSSGVVTGVKHGEVTITVRSARNDDIVARLPLQVIDPLRPEEIIPSVASLRLEVGETFQPTVSILPLSASQKIGWRSSRSSVASVDSRTGKITARRAGSINIYVESSYDKTVYCVIPITVYKLPTPKKLTLDIDKTVLKMDETARITLTPTPADASVLCEYKVSGDAVTVDASGLITPRKLGSATVIVTSLKDRNVRASVEVTVFDPLIPISVTLSEEMAYLKAGQSLQLIGTVFPATASQSLYWSSGDTSVAVVSDEGRVSAVGAGTTVIRGVTENDVYAVCTVAVSSDKRVTVIPERTTSISGIPLNLQKIDSIRRSAISQIISLAESGAITYSESLSRQQVINNAFEMQAFPWMTPGYQRYWTEKYLEKSYLPGKVYYGLPYIQRSAASSANRRYTAAKAVKENRYIDSGKGYYLLNQDRLLDGMYVGNDCSAFVSMAYWGLNHSASFLRTGYMATSKYYRQLKNYGEMRTGDFLLLPEEHVIMFLYWVDSAKTKMMIIEQGGDGNTVICSVKDIAHYQTELYQPYRLATYAQN